jgi:anti-sigma-K factor RskA
MSQPIDVSEDRLVEYVLGELRRDDAQALEHLIRDDADLAAEVRRLRQVFDLLPYATLTEPPPELRTRVLDAAAARAKQPAAPVVAPAEPRRARRVVWSQFAAAAAAALALAFGVDAWRTRQELTLQREMTAALQEPNVVRSFALAGTGSARGAVGRVALDLDAKKGAVVLKGMPELPEGQVYRLWAKVKDKDVPCGEFKADPQGAVLAQFVVPVESYTAPLGKLFVTVEPASLPATPTGPTVMESV